MYRKVDHDPKKDQNEVKMGTPRSESIYLRPGKSIFFKKTSIPILEPLIYTREGNQVD